MIIYCSFSAEKMPEGPEVHCLSESLNELYSGQILHAIEINEKSRYFKEGFPGFPKMEFPITLLSVSAYGKKLIFEFPNGYLVSSLGLEGHWLTFPRNNTGLILKFDKPLYYDDSRHFGRCTFCQTQAELKQLFKDTGPDWLSEQISYSYFMCVIQKHPRMKLCDFLLEQKYFSGIGNYLKAEILYEAKLSPHRELGTLKDETQILYSAIKSVIHEAYTAGGTSVYTWTDPLGRKGTFSLRVYSKKTDPNGHKVLAETITKKSRTTYWVPQVQV